MDLTFAPPTSARVRSSAVGRWVTVFAGCLLGYAFLGRTFAYVGLPPLFVGEVMLVLGLGVAVGKGRLGAALGAWPLRLWGLLLVWTAARTLPYVATFGLDAPRDAMLVAYGFYAVVLAALLLAEPDRLRQLVGSYRTLVAVMLAAVWFVYGVTKLLGPGVPSLPWAPGVGVLSAKGGDLMVHMTGVVAFLMLGGRRLTPAVVAMAVFSAVIIMVSNRGGMVAFALGLGVVWLMRPSGTGAGRFAYALAAFVVAAALLGPLVQVKIQDGTRDLSLEQVAENVKSIFVSSNSMALDGTKRWRLLWWGDIVDYTVRGPYFWTGKGFGVNLAEVDGYAVDEDDDSLRSPHNGHMTVLARAGVPGLVLWALVHLTWIAGVLRAWLRARLLDERRWMALFAWLAGFWVAALVNASFDVYLEGPMGGIWLWSVVGIGIAAVRLHKTHPHLLDPLDVLLPPAHDRPRADSAPTFGW